MSGRSLVASAFPPALLLLGLIVLWEIGVIVFEVPKFLVPRPSEIFLEALSLDSLMRDFLITGAESFAGFVIGSSAAIIGGVLLYSSRTLEASLTPLAIGMKTVPIVAVAPLLVAWFGFGIVTKILLSALICFFPALINTLQGLKEVDRSYLDLFKSMAASRVSTYRYLLFPSAAVSIFSALRVTVVLSVIGAIVAEFAGATSGLGFRIIIASYQLETPKMFVYILATAILGLLLYGIVVVAERLVTPWAQRYRS